MAKKVVCMCMESCLACADYRSLAILAKRKTLEHIISLYYEAFAE